MKYKLLYGYYTEGLAFEDEEFDSIDEAVKHGVANGYTNPFKVVTIHWEPKHKKEIKP